MGIFKEKMRLVFVRTAKFLDHVAKMEIARERPVQRPDYGRVNSKHCEMKIICQRYTESTERAHHKGLHDKRGIEIIAQTAESFLGCHTVLLSKSQVR